MAYYQERFYRDYHKSPSLHSYKVCIDSSDLYIASTNASKDIAMAALRTAREALKNIISQYPQFLSSLTPIDIPCYAPPASWMITAAKVCNVGPMAAVAGAISQYVGEALLKSNKEVLVENGGDIYLSSISPRKILVYAGNSPVSMNLAIKIPAGTFGICTSAGKVGPSLSFGIADAAIVLSKDCALSDAAATRLGNLVKSENDLKSVVESINDLPNILGAMAICNDKIAACGQIELTTA